MSFSSPQQLFEDESMSFCYTYCDLLVKSEIFFPELSAYTGETALSTIFFNLTHQQPLHICDWDYEWISDGELTCSMKRLNDSYLLRMPTNIDFYISENGSTIRCNCAADESMEDIRHILLDRVLPRVLSHLHYFMLHGSAIETPNGVVIMLGQSGMGKSTLAGYLHQKGFRLLTDDCMALRLTDSVVECHPSYTGLRLWPHSISALYDDTVALYPMAHYSIKRRVLLTDDGAQKTNRVAAILVLGMPVVEQEAGLTLNPIPPAQATIRLIENSFRLDMSAKVETKSIFQQATSIAGHVPTYRLIYPRTFEVLPEVCNAILKIVKEA